MIEIKNLKFKYHQDQPSYILDDVSFHVKRGEWLSIVGHNGSGKSTTARLIDGLLVAESGQIIVDGQELTEDNVWDIRDKIGMVFQNPDNQFVGATVEDDVAFGPENLGMTTKEIRQQVDDALKAVGMEKFKNFAPHLLSGGQKQRLSIARAICRHPEILIFDDSFSALDYKTDRVLRDTLRKTCADATRFIVAQRIGTIRDADKIIVLDDGKIAGMGKHNELMETCEVYRQIAYSQLSKEELA